MPTDYPLHGSPTAQILAAELDFFVDIDAEPYAHEVGDRFLLWLQLGEDWGHPLLPLPPRGEHYPPCTTPREPRRRQPDQQIP